MKAVERRTRRLLEEKVNDEIERAEIRAGRRRRRQRCSKTGKSGYGRATCKTICLAPTKPTLLPMLMSSRWRRSAGRTDAVAATCYHFNESQANTQNRRLVHNNHHGDFHAILLAVKFSLADDGDTPTSCCLPAQQQQQNRRPIIMKYRFSPGLCSVDRRRVTTASNNMATSWARFNDNRNAFPFNSAAQSFVLNNLTY